MAVLRFGEDEAADFSHGDVYFIGNATTLIRFGGITILTDPAFMHKGTHTYLGHGIWARREVEPACQVADLRPIDLLLLSHYHGDHFDDAAARDLDHDLPVISTADAVSKLQPLGFRRGYPLDTWQSHRVEKGQARLEVTAMPAKHATDDAIAAMLMPVNGHMLEFSRGDQQLYRLYITGDTMPNDQLNEIPRAYPDIDLGLFHTGGTTLFVTVVTMTGEQAVRAVEIVRPHTAIPIHYNDYSVFMSGLDDFRQAAARSSADTTFHYLAHGETYTFSAKVGAVEGLGEGARQRPKAGGWEGGNDRSGRRLACRVRPLVARQAWLEGGAAGGLRSGRDLRRAQRRGCAAASAAGDRTTRGIPGPPGRAAVLRSPRRAARA